MKKGSQEWFEKVESNIDFPAKVAFFYGNDGNILSQVLDSKASDVNNIQWKRIRPALLLDGTKLAVLGVHQLKDAQEYFDVSEEYNKHWKKEETK